MGLVVGNSATTVALVTSAGVQLNPVSEGRDRLAQRVEDSGRSWTRVPRSALTLPPPMRCTSYFSKAWELLSTSLSHLVVASDGALENIPLAILVTGGWKIILDGSRSQFSLPAGDLAIRSSRDHCNAELCGGTDLPSIAFGRSRPCRLYRLWRSRAWSDLGVGGRCFRECAL